MEHSETTDLFLEKMTNCKIDNAFDCMELLNSVLNDCDGQISYQFIKGESFQERKWRVSLDFQFYNLKINWHHHGDDITDKSLGRACLIAYLWIINRLKHKNPPNTANNTIEDFEIN